MAPIIVHPASVPALSLLLACCVGGLLVILCIPADKTALIKRVSAGASGLALIISVWLFVAYDAALGGFQFAERLAWVPSLGIAYFNALDGFSTPMVLLTGIVFFTAVLTSWELDHRVKEFFALLFLLVAGVFGMFMSLDLFFIFVYFDISLFPMYLLIAVWGSTRKEYGAMKLTLYLLAGSALILPAIVYLVAHSGRGTFDVTVLMQPGTFTAAQQRLAFLLLYVGFGILAAVWPFHTWSPVGHGAAPTAVSMIHAGVLMKIGAFGILRVGIFLCPEGWQYWSHLMAVLAVVGIVYGAFVGLRQTDLKFVIGYSSVSHMGIVGLGLATGTVDGLTGAVFQMFAHGLMTALFFSAVGYIYDRTHTKMIAELGGLGRTMPVATGYFVIAALTGIGVPCLASFWAELTVFVASFSVYPLYGALAVAALVVSALFMLRVVQRTCFGPENPRLSHLADIPVALAVPRAMLVAAILFFGLFPSVMADMIHATAAQFLGGLP